MSAPGTNSNFDLPKGKWNFTNEPLWFKLCIYVITVLFYLGTFMILKVWALPALVASGFSFKFGNWFGRERSG